MLKAGSTTWVQIFLSLVGAGFSAYDVEQRGQDSTQDATSGDEKLENRIHAISIMVKQYFYTFSLEGLDLGLKAPIIITNN